MEIIKVTPELVDSLCGQLESIFSPDHIDEWRKANQFIKYQKDPVGFGTEILKERYTEDVKRMMESVRDYRITIAISSNGVGKSHAAASLAIWWYKCFPDSKIFTAAAPPEDNLRNILWGEIAKKQSHVTELFDGDKIRDLNISRNRWHFIEGLTIPQAGSEAIREAKFCSDADELFELQDGSLVTYRSLIGKKINVISIDEHFQKVKAKAEFFDNGIQGVYEITLSSGQIVTRTGEHLFFVGKIGQSFKKSDSHHTKGRYLVDHAQWTPTNKIQAGDAILIPDNTSFNFGSVAIDENKIKILAYLIGDGCISDSRRVLFIQENNRQLDDFKRAVTAIGATVVPYNLKEYSWKINGNGSGLIGSNSVISLLREYDLINKDSATKYIPEKIMQANRECIALFLNRLFSTDGWACICRIGKKYQKAEIGYVSKSERLVKDIQRLLHRFGISSNINVKESFWKHKGIKKSNFYWSCTICKSNDIIKFAKDIGIYGKEAALEQCVDYARNRTAYASWRKSRYDGFKWDKIKSIKYVGQRETVGVYVPQYNTYLTNIVEHNSGKHAAHLLFIIDEGDAVPNEVYRGIDSCMSGTHDRLLIMFNPRAKMGKVYDYIINGMANIVEMVAFNHPNVVRGMNIIPGAVSREITVQRINEQTRPLIEGEEPDSKCFELPSFLEGSTAPHPRNNDFYPPLPAGWRKVKDECPEFWYKVLAKYPPQGSNQLINPDWIRDARSRWDLYTSIHGDQPPKDIRPICGLDVADMGDDSNVLCSRYGGYVARMERWSGVDPTETADRAADKGMQYNSHCINVDAIGVGAGVPNGIRKRGVRANRVDAHEKPTKVPPDQEHAKFGILRDQILWEVRIWLKEDPTAMLPPNDKLLQELELLTYEEDNGKIRVMSTDKIRQFIGRSPDDLMALALTFSPKERAPKVRKIK